MHRWQHIGGLFALMVGFLIPLLGHAQPRVARSSTQHAVAAGRVLLVGPERTYSTPSQAAAVAQDGDTIEIDAGTYLNDWAVWRANNLTIRGVGGLAHLASSEIISNDKAIWVIAGQNTTVENIEFSGARVDDRNGAGIRQEGAGLTVRSSYFHDNENGILAGDNGNSDIVIEYSEFANNGLGDPGRTHNMYINHVRSFTLRSSYSHHANIGHNVKSRALKTVLLYNRIEDQATGTASYSVNVPNGGETYLIGNVIQKGANASNNAWVMTYADEGATNPVQQLYVVNNTIVNDRSNSVGVWVAGTPSTAVFTNNLLAGQIKLPDNPAVVSTANLIEQDPQFVDRAAYDYHLTAGSPAIDAGVAPGSANGMDLTPTQQYVHVASSEARAVSGAAIDVGAFEYANAPTPPAANQPVAAVNVNGAAVAIDGVNFQAEADSGLSVSGGSRFADQNVQLSPATDEARAQMIRSSVWNSSGTLNVELPVANGTYQVYLYTWEDNNAMDFRLAFEGQAQGGTQSTGAAATWKRIGPYTATVADGRLTITATGGHFMLSGIEVYGGATAPDPTPTPAPTTPPSAAVQDLPGPTMDLSVPAGRVVDVSSIDQLADAMANAAAGDVITLAPGTYDLDAKLSASRSGTSAQPIYVRAARLGDVEIRARSEEGVLITGDYWTFENLRIVGVCEDHFDCDNIFHIVGDTHDIVIRNNRLLDYNAPFKTNADLFGDPNRKYPHDVLIEHNLVQHTAPRLPSQYRSVNGVNIDGGYNFTVRANVMLDIAKGDADAEAGFMKANGRDGIFERNLVICQKHTTGGERIGLSMGGGGANADIYDFNPPQRGVTPEWNDGIVRNNVSINCDVGFYNNNGWQTKLYNNTLYNSTDVQSRFGASHLIVTNNVIQGIIRLRDGGTAEDNGNVFLGSAADFTRYFQDPTNMLFSLNPGENPVRGTAQILPEVTDDICGVPRGSAHRDMGAFNSDTNPDCAAAIQSLYQGY